MVGADGRTVREDHDIELQDFVVTTSNKPLDFLQHIMTILDINGRAAVVPTTCCSRAEPVRRNAASCSRISICTR
jgi:type I restriction-modification system DNA methylase subunit